MLLMHLLVGSTTLLVVLFMGRLALADEVQLWSACTVQYCAYLYETPPCDLSVKVTTTSGLTLFQEPFDLAVSNEVCTSFLGCTYCIELQNLTQSNDGGVYPCIYLKTTCGSGSTTSSSLGCVTASNELGQCLTQGCPNGCSAHGSCLSTGVCSCNSGWYGSDCSLQAPLFDQCVTIPQYGDVCLKLETEECAVAATVYLQEFPSVPLYNKLIEAPVFGTYFSTVSCFSLAVNCGACLYWNNFVLNETYARGCPVLLPAFDNPHSSCTGLPSGTYAFDCFEDAALVPACFGTCPENCSSNGECVNGACACNSQYTGSTCAIPRCDQLYNCYGNGECIAPNTCQCNTGYTGASCAAAVCDGVPVCSGNGKCIGPNICKCNANFTGSTCSEIACPYDCKNGGQCSIGTCKCVTGWEGADCGTKQGLTPTPASNPSTSTYVVIGVVIGLLIAGAGGAVVFFLWRRKQRAGRAFTSFDDGLIQVPERDTDTASDS